MKMYHILIKVMGTQQLLCFNTHQTKLNCIILTFGRFFHRLVKTSSPTDTDLWVWREAGRTVSGYRITKGFFWMDGDWSMCIDRREGGSFWAERPKPLEMGGGWLMERKDYSNQNFDVKQHKLNSNYLKPKAKFGAHVIEKSKIWKQCCQYFS